MKCSQDAASLGRWYFSADASMSTAIPGFACNCEQSLLLKASQNPRVDSTETALHTGSHECVLPSRFQNLPSSL